MSKHVAPLITQRDALPTRKVTAGALAGAVTVIGVAIAEAFGVVVPAEVASSITTVLAFVASYFVRDRG